MEIVAVGYPARQGFITQPFYGTVNHAPVTFQRI